MGTSLLITLREGLEISLVLAIIFAYLDKSNRPALRKPVWIGSAAAASVSLIAGVMFHQYVGDFEGKTEEFVEGVLALAAAGVLTWMIFWMRTHARGIKGELHSKIDAAIEHSPFALGLVAFVAVAREGFETALFLVSAESDGSSGANVVVGGLVGLSVAAVIGVMIYQGSHRVDLRRFFFWTGTLLLLFAAGLVAKGVHEFRALLGIDWGLVADPVWEVTSGPFAKGHSLHDFAKGLFGWSPSPERVRVAAYFAYLVPVGLYYLGDSRSASPADKQTDAQEVSTPG